MGKIKLFVEKYRTVFNVLLFILAVTMGGGVMAAGGIEKPQWYTGKLDTGAQE